MTDETRRFAGLGSAVAAIAAGAVVMLLPRPDALPPEAHRLGALFVICLVLWATEAMPLAA